MNLFISGWAGFKEALGDTQEDCLFIIPFVDYDERGIIDFLKDRKGSNLIAWSTGGHIVLKNISFFTQRFESIIIVAGFIRFTDYVKEKVIRRMINKMSLSPHNVVKDFLISAGCTPTFPDFDHDKLIKGLEYLCSSKIEVSQKLNIRNLKLIHGTQDKILPVKAIFDLKEIFPQAEVYLLDNAPHWVSFEKIRKFLSREK